GDRLSIGHPGGAGAIAEGHDCRRHGSRQRLVRSAGEVAARACLSRLCDSCLMPMLTRRAVLAGPAMLAAAPAQTRPRNIVISSENGLRACARAMEILKAGGDTLDAVVAGVNINELDPEDSSVGYGGLPNEEGI